MMDRGSLAMHEPVGADHLATEDVADTLMPQTHAQGRDGRAKRPDDVVGQPGLARGTRSG